MQQRVGKGGHSSLQLAISVKQQVARSVLPDEEEATRGDQELTMGLPNGPSFFLMEVTACT
jgi:hypothetical protein